MDITTDLETLTTFIYETKIRSAIQKFKNELVDQLDNYLEYALNDFFEQWESEIQELIKDNRRQRKVSVKRVRNG